MGGGWERQSQNMSVLKKGKKSPSEEGLKAKEQRSISSDIIQSGKGTHCSSVVSGITRCDWASTCTNVFAQLYNISLPGVKDARRGLQMDMSSAACSICLLMKCMNKEWPSSQRWRPLLRCKMRKKSLKTFPRQSKSTGRMASRTNKA